MGAFSLIVVINLLNSIDMPRSRSRSVSGRRRRSPSPGYSRRRSPSPEYRKRRSPSPEYSRRRSPSPEYRRRERSRSPPRGGGRGGGPRGGRGNPAPSRCLGIFGLSDRTSEREIHKLFSHYPGFLNVRLIKDYITDRTRGFGFMNFDNVDDATYVRDKCNGMEIDGRIATVEFSHSNRAVTPTPGVYCGARERDRGFRTAPRYRSRSRSRSGGRR